MYPDISGSRQALAKFSSSRPAFACVISHTATSEIPGLTVAGANPELVKLTSPADAEFLHYGSCRCIPGVPATPDGKPTPAVITRAALALAEIPLLVVEAGTKVKPAIPAVSFGLIPGGNISTEDAMSAGDVHRAIDYGQVLGLQLAKASDLVVIGESIPGGTTTALAVLTAIGIDARGKVSSSMPDNPHALKNKVVAQAISRSKPKKGIGALAAVALVGDPMMPSVAGIAAGAIMAGAKVMLAGGTQMAPVLAVLKSLEVPLKNVCVGTTKYVAGDQSADLAGLVRAVAPGVPILSCDLHFEESKKPGLRAFAQGFVKEGVGAGGSSIAAMIKSRGRITGKKLLSAIEKEYASSIERAPSRT
ncbi:MAG: TIGR00303 family protein [Nitrososphaera sp.]|uniref:nicotinate mononucleotide-dependent phosphoribosyltransferase CobT n=1 Tax=Nitrososphaera sp. TaxID=1971748 RepID=UPI00317F9F9C